MWFKTHTLDMIRTDPNQAGKTDISQKARRQYLSCQTEDARGRPIRSVASGLVPLSHLDLPRFMAYRQSYDAFWAMTLVGRQIDDAAATVHRITAMFASPEKLVT
jgi:hypothetical protein